MAQNNQRVKVNTQEEHRQEELQDVGNSITIKLEGQPEHLQQSSKVDCDVVSSSIMKDYLARELKRQLHRQDLMRTSFQPTEYPKPGEIYPGVFKGLYSDFVHSSEPLFKDLDKTAQAEESSPISTVLILKILKNQLQLLNLDDHLPLPELSDGDYRVLKLLWNSNPEKMLRDIEQVGIVFFPLKKYEFHRRVVTLANQITQHTILENWPLIKKSLECGAARTSKSKAKPRPSRSFLQDYESFFQLNQKFPDVLVGSNNLFSKKMPIVDREKGKKFSLELYASVVGHHEYHRRQRCTKHSATMPQWELSDTLYENLKQAEKSNGVNVWNISHLIRWLGLGEETNFEHCSESQVNDCIIVLRDLILNWYNDTNWYQSADRAWMKATFKNKYHQQFNSLCQTFEWMKAEDYASSIKEQGSNRGAILDSGMISNIIKNQMEQELTLNDYGLNKKTMLSINLLKEKMTNEDGYTDWHSVWSYFPQEMEFTMEQRKFATTWLENMEATIKNLQNGKGIKD
jgi:hypothetical protein